MFGCPPPPMFPKMSHRMFPAHDPILPIFTDDFDVERTREVFERAIANVPPAAEKRLWRRYIYLWLKYAIFEELKAKDVPRTREVLEACRKLLPHTHFTFAKFWVHFAHFEVRHDRLDSARKLLGFAIGRCPKDKSFKAYIELELQLGEVQRCRQLYQKYLEWAPSKCSAWTSFAELEASLGETERCRAIYEVATQQTALDMPEVLWKGYIDFEIDLNETERARALYRQLLERTQHVKVYLSFGAFERISGGGMEAAEGVFAEAEALFKERGLKEERLLLLEGWRDAHTEAGDADKAEQVQSRMPKRIKKKRPIVGEDGEAAGWEEFYDYVYPEEEAKAPSLKILEMAQKWKKQKTQPNGDADE